MLCSIKELDGYTLAARDGEIGTVREVYLDDARWAVRHLVVTTGGWLSSREVLISPHAVQHLDREQRRIEVSLTRQQVEAAPGVDTDKPIARQYETAHHDHYGYPYYWGGTGLWGAEAYPLGAGLVTDALPDPTLADEVARAERAEREAADPNLRSSAEVIGYHVAAADGAIGHIDDFLFDDRSWAIRWAVVDTRNWLPDRLVLVALASIDGVDWAERRVRVRLAREAVKASPAYNPAAGVTRDEELKVQRHFAGWS